jgi:TusA-related sulfurtransferase
MTSDFKADVSLDASGLPRPLPVLRARKEIDRMAPGQVLEVAATTPGTGEDIALYTDRVGHELLGSRTDEEVSYFYIKKKP